MLKKQIILNYINDDFFSFFFQAIKMLVTRVNKSLKRIVRVIKKDFDGYDSVRWEKMLEIYFHVNHALLLVLYYRTLDEDAVLKSIANSIFPTR